MSMLSWLSPKIKKLEDEKRELKAELTQSIMRFERRKSEIEGVANDALNAMHRRRSTDKNETF